MMHALFNIYLIACVHPLPFPPTFNSVVLRIPDFRYRIFENVGVCVWGGGGGGAE